jgi:GT2 family glycosyltransferase
MAVEVRDIAESTPSVAGPDVDYILHSKLRPTMPAVSVVITTHDHGPYLRDAVNAIAAQDLDGEVETIVCDNASGDDTEALMRELVEGARRPLTYARLKRDVGPARGRNIGMDLAIGRFTAFTDADCVPRPDWLRAAIAQFGPDRVGVVQGRTIPTELRVPLFEHHIAIDRLDGTFATANLVYRREALRGLAFDSTCAYWEDVDLGWRVLDAGWHAAFAPDAVVAHRVIKLTPRLWVTWPAHYRSLPAIVKRHRGYRRHLFLGIWVRPLHLLFDVALVGVIATLWRWEAVALAIPYLVAFFLARGVKGRFPPAKIAAHLAWDVVAFATLATASVRNRAVVL